MIKIIGLTGAHRTGKTTLAEEVCRENDWIFVPTSMTAIWQKIGFDPSKPTGMQERLDAQFFALDEIEALYRRLPKDEVLVLDRTPIDMAAYTMAEVHPGNVTDKQSESVQRYVARCIELTNNFFGLLFIVQPGIEIVDAPGKAAPIPAYMDHLNALCFGFLASEAVMVPHYYIPRRMTNLQDRVSAINNAYGTSINRQVNKWLERGASPLFH